MKRTLSVLGVTALVMLCSCATPGPPPPFHYQDKSAVIIKSLNDHSSQLIAPTPTAETINNRIVDQLKSFPQRSLAVVILENYSEPVLGPEFRDRSVDWMLTLRLVGYQHIVFLRGKGVGDPEGLPILAQYF